MEKKTKTRIRRKNGGIRKVFFWLILLFLVIQIFIRVVVPASVTFSRYVYKAARNYYFNSKEFYFNSNRLSEDTAIFEAENWSGADSYPIKVVMDSRKNIEEICKVNVQYNIKYTCDVYKANGEKYTTDKVNFVIDGISEANYNPDTGISKTIFTAADPANTGANNTSGFEFSVSVLEDEKLENDDYIFITIIAEATEPYKKTLKGTFKISIGTPGMSYQIEDSPYSPYCNVIITNTLDYYVVDEEFNGHDSGSHITIAEYFSLSDENKAKCHSMNIDIKFDPQKVVMDTTSLAYLSAVQENLATYTQIIDENGNSVNYVNGMTFKMDAEESRIVKFYKVVAANDYSYPISNSTEPPVVEVKELKGDING